MSRIPQPTRLRQPPSSPSPSTASTRKSFLSPKTIWTPSSKRTTPTVAKYQLQDPGVVPGSPKVVKRGTIRPPNTSGKGKTSTIYQKSGGSGTNAMSNTPEIGSPMSNSAVVDSTIPSSPSPSRIPASQSYTQIYQPSSRRIDGIPSTSRIPLPQSRIDLKSPQPHLRSGIPIPKPKFPTLVNNPCHSPAISICATVATVSPQSSPIPGYEHECEPDPEYEPVFVPVMTMDRNENLSAHESIYSSASAMALSRYRASLPDNIMEMKERSTVDRGTEQGHDLSRISSTTSYSSASSLARHRLSQARSQCQVQAQPMSGTTSTSSESEQALIWQPDPESTGFDPAENLWKEIEARLNRRPASTEGGKDERGQWVLTSRQKEKGRYCQNLARTDKVDIPDRIAIASTSIEMEKQESEFTISAYFDPDLSTHLTSSETFKRTTGIGLCTGMNNGRATGSDVGMEGTALFDMSAPLVISNFQNGHENENEHGDRDRDGYGDGDGEVSVGKTPANTPLIHHETIQRVQRVRKSTLGIQSVGMGSRRSGSGSRSRASRSRFNANIAHSELWSLMRSRSESSSAVVDLGSSARSSTSTTTSTAFPPLQIQTGAPTRISSHTRTASISPSSTLECPPSRSAANYDISMTRLDSHVQAALEELSDYRSIYPTTTTTIVAGDRTPLARDKGVCGSIRAGGRYPDHQNQHHEHHHRYQYEDGYVNEGAVSELGEDESTPMPIPNTVRMSPTIPHSSDNNEYPLGTMEQIREEIRSDDVGLGMGIDLRLDSVYSLLPVLSPRLRIPIPFPAPVPGRVSSPLLMSETDETSRSSTSDRTSSSESILRSFSSDSSNSPRPLSVDTSLSRQSESEGDGSIYKTHNLQDEDDIPLLSQPPLTINHKHERISFEQGHVVPDRAVDTVEEEEEEEMLTITDLDTGHRVDLSIKRLDELELWRL